jgi:hypothetical protein
MKKLNKRQIIILSVAVLLVLFAVYELLIARPSAKKAKTEVASVEKASFADTLRKDILTNKGTAVDTYVAQRAEMEWNKNPFWEANSYREFAGRDASSGGGEKITYSGYVDAGNKKMAIINGWEYEAGDALEIEGYLLKKVTPTRVLIINRTTGGESYIQIQE